MNPLSPGPMLIALGVGLILIGLLFWSGSMSWFGKLPGDIRIERETVRVYVPIVSMLLVSMVVSLVLYLVRRFF
jgi:NAD/NADP transhydrogenase beta subunit